MWRASTPDGTLTYTFVETVKRPLSRTTVIRTSPAAC